MMLELTYKMPEIRMTIHKMPLSTYKVTGPSYGPYVLTGFLLTL